MERNTSAHGFSFEIERPEAELGSLEALDLDLGDLTSEKARAEPSDGSILTPRMPSFEQVTPRVPRAGNDGSETLVARSATPLMPHALAARASGLPAPSSSPAEAPIVKRLAFPSAGASSVKSSPRPQTRFSDSVGRRRVILESDPPPPGPTNLDSILPGAPVSEPTLRELAQSSIAPVDLPARAPQGGPSDGPSFSPSELWQKARLRARGLGEHGLHSSRLWAEQVSEAVRSRLAGARFTKTSAAAGPTRSTLVQASRRYAGPALALAAALAAFVASRHFLGPVGIPLEHRAPAVPDLGSLAAAPGEPPASASGAAAQAAAPRSSGPAPMVTEVTHLPEGMSWPGKGLLEVVTAEDELVYVDGVFTGRGPLRRVPVTPGAHEIRILKDGSERKGSATVEAEKATRAIFKGR